jgi:predicted nucleic acid-binding protein
LSTEFDVERTLRWLKPQRWTRPLSRRPDDELQFIRAVEPVSTKLMLDSCVYVDVLQGKTPTVVDALLKHNVCNHSAVCLAELTYLFGRLDPADPRTPGALEQVQAVIKNVAPFRMSAPTTDVLGAAGILAGALCRLSDRVGENSPLLVDACLYLHARKLGLTTLTRNVRDFDLLNQLVPDGRVIFYRVPLH